MGAIAASHAMPSAASPSSQAPPSLPVSDAAARWAAHRARTWAVHSSCSAELPSRRSRSAREMCAHTLTGCPARSGSSLAATSRRMASGSASWYRCSWVRSSSSPAGADSASSTLPTTAAHSGVRSPLRTPAPWNVVSSRTPRSANARSGSSSGQVAAGPLVHLGEQRRQVRQPQPVGRGLHQQLIGLVPVLLRQPVGPLADRPAVGLRQLPGGQRGDDPGMAAVSPRPRGV